MSTIEAAVCWPCVCALHEECLALVEAEEEGTFRCCCTVSKLAAALDDATRGPGRPPLDPADITDIKSTGRKRAKMAAPIPEDGMLCEWAGLARAGGGMKPIVGCRDHWIRETKSGAEAGHRHHGPDKNTLNNAGGNLHRICTSCHNRWHSLNNPFYEGERPSADQPWLPEGDWLKHDPITLATEEEFEESAEFWAKTKIERGLDTDD